MCHGESLRRYPPPVKQLFSCEQEEKQLLPLSLSLSLRFTQFSLLFIYRLDVRSEPATLQSDLSHISNQNLILLCVMDASAKLHINASAPIEAGLEVSSQRAYLSTQCWSKNESREK